MISLAMLFWIGYTLNAPALYWWGWGLTVAYYIGKLLYNFYKIGTKTK